MLEALAAGAYRGVMTVAAGIAGLVSRVPGAPARWRALGDRLARTEEPEADAEVAAPVIWLHAASVGEVVAARPLLRRLREGFPDRRYLVTTLTRTGLEVARSFPEADATMLFPLDAPGPVRRLLGRLPIEAFLFTETEIWPNCLAALADAGVPAFMVSGRLSRRTAARTGLLRPLYRRALAPVTCCMQTEEDARRAIALGADPRFVRVAGSLKYDGGADPPPDVARVGAALGLGTRRLVVAGSTREGEDEVVLAAYRRLAPGHADLLLMLAPRHPERVPAVAALVEAAGYPLVRYSELAAAPEGTAAVPAPAVVLLDVVGPLAHCYALGVVAFVGGSLVPAGGHNVIEPARAGRPVLVGPHTTNAPDVVERLVTGGGALRVSSAESLAWALAGLLAEPARAAEMGRRARALVESGQGPVERHLKIIAARLTSARFARSDPP